MLQPDKDKKKTTVLGKTVNPKSTLGRYANNSLLTPDFDGNKNVSGKEFAVDMGMNIIGGGIIGKIAKSVGGKAIGKGLTRVIGSYFPSSGKNIAKKAASIVAKKRSTLKTNAIKEPSPKTNSIFEGRVNDVENVKLTPVKARKQLDEQLKKMKK